MPSNSDAQAADAGSAKKLSAAEIARDWQRQQGTTGPSRAYVSACIKKGCPTDSFDAAWDWRVKNSKYGVGYRSKGGKTTQAGDVESPAESVAEPPATPKIASLNALESSLKAAIQMEEIAHRNALALKTEAAIRAYNNARDGRFEAERAFREEMERRRILVPLDEAKQLGRKGWDVMLPALRALGSRVGGDANPVDAVRAAGVIDREVEGIIAQAEAAYAA